MTEPKVHYEDPASPRSRPWAWCSASIHGRVLTRRTKHVTCMHCALKAVRLGAPKYRPWRKRP